MQKLSQDAKQNMGTQRFFVKIFKHKGEDCGAKGPKSAIETNIS